MAAEDQLKRVDIRSPQSGIVHQLSVHTVGGVEESQKRHTCPGFCPCYEKVSSTTDFVGEPGGIRTLDHMIKSHVLYP